MIWLELYRAYDHPKRLGSCETPYLAIVPCDAPRFPLDLVERWIKQQAHATVMFEDASPFNS
jgi:molybdopterin-guanine dinucleotide biosynthesis protein A